MEKDMKFEFDLVIRAKSGDMTLQYNPTIRKWEAMRGQKVLARRKNVEMLVAAVNSAEAALAGSVEA